MASFRHLRVIATALVAALVLLVAPSAQAQTITNTAAAQWTIGAHAFSASSNTVVFNVTQQPATIQTFTSASSSGQALSFAPALCGQKPIIVPGGLGATDPVASVEQASTLRIGNVLYFKVVAPTANLDSSRIDTLTAALTTDSGDAETVQVTETGVNTGVFIGAMPTTGIPPKPVKGDCRLSVSPGDHISVAYSAPGNTGVLATAQVQILADPYGLVFDSEDGSPIDGVRVTIVDALTGAPARILADDGVTPWPSTVITGSTVTDGAGNVYQMLPGEYRFPLAALGQYRLKVEPPAPYTTPSTMSPAQLSGLHRADGFPLQLGSGSYGGAFSLVDLTAVRVDIPADRPPVSVTLSKVASRASALPGDAVFYTVTARNPDSLHGKHNVVLTDTPSALLRLRSNTVRVDGAAAPGAVQVSADGRLLTVSLGDVGPGATRTVTYAMTIRPDAPAGQAINKATATDSRGLSSTASAVVQIEQDTLAARMTLIGRITDGGCAVEGTHKGIAGVRLVLEDGSFAVTDAEGRYHFEGLVPGTHVVQALTGTLPRGGQFTDCTRSTRSAGSASSRFVIGQGGSLQVADFSATLPEQSKATISNSKNTAENAPAEASDKVAAGGDVNWLTVGNGPDGFLFPAIDHNPRSPAIRVVIRHRVGQKVELKANGKPVGVVSYDGARSSADGSYAISVWRGIQLDGATTRLDATLRNADGSVGGNFSRDVHFVDKPARIELVAQYSRLIADGTSRPVLALRILDNNGRPVHAGLSGDLSLSAPYESAAALDAMQSRALSGLGRDAPHWLVKGDDGLALVELAPTMVSGKLHVEFNLSDGQQHRRQELETWIVPGDQPWTLVGLAEGSLGSRSVADNMERTGQFDSDLGQNARVAFYAKGRVLGKVLLTLAYDSAKQRNDTALLGAIDPRAYYTVFADGSDRRFDAASRQKLYVRIEAKAFYAIFGDIDTGFNQTQLARYQRTVTGIKAELNVDNLHTQVYAAKIASSHRHDEIQGGGITGPYRLSSRAIIANSEQVSLEVRDRFRSELVVSRQALTRFVDYDIDLLSGTISFKSPVLSRDFSQNPQFIVIDYELEDTATGGEINAGMRTDLTVAHGRVRIGATSLTDTSVNGSTTSATPQRTNLAAVDLRARLGDATEIRAEAGMSFNAGTTAQAFLLEAEHHDGKFDFLGYARSADQDFGVGQTTGAERGRRKFGLDTRYRASDALALNASTWYDQSLTDPSHRSAVQLGAQYRTRNAQAQVGLSMLRDHLLDGTDANSTVLDAGVTQHVLDNKLELSATTSLALDHAASVDLPERQRFGARYTLSPALKLVGSYEIATSSTLDARTAAVGFEMTPWHGARIVSSLGQQDVAEYGKRSYAAFGLGQSVEVNKHLTLDATLDSNRSLSSFDVSRLINASQPASSGGNLGENGSIAEDFTAMTLGGTWRNGRWSATTRGEWRDGQLARRVGVTFGTIRQLGDGSMLGSGLTWTRARANGGALSEVLDSSIAAAFRPAASQLAFLTKLQYRSDKLLQGAAGSAGAAGQTALLVDGDARSRRLIGSISADWTPHGHNEDGTYQRTSIGVFTALRHNFDSYQGFDLAGTTMIGGVDARIGLGERVEIGAVTTVRKSLSDHTTQFAVGPQIGISPTKDMLLTLGYNISGFRDRDFSAMRNTDKGVFVTMRMKVDADSFGFLGLNRR